MGPLSLPSPSSLVNSLTKYYALNLGVWNAWSIIYAVFGCLITAIHANDVNAILNGDLGSFGLGPTLGATGPLDGGIETIGLISIMYAICILLIPMVAAFILRGQFSAVGAGVSLAVSRIAQGASRGAELGAAAGPAGAVAGDSSGRNGADGCRDAVSIFNRWRLRNGSDEPGWQRKHAASQYARRP